MPPLHGGVVVSCRSPNLRFRRLAFRHRIECAAKNSDATQSGRARIGIKS